MRWISMKIVEIKDYGKVIIKLQEYMEPRGISRNSLAVDANTRFEVVDKWYKGDVEKLDLDVLARFCYVLECGINDIIEYIK